MSASPNDMQTLLSQLQQSGILSDVSPGMDSGLLGKATAAYGGPANLGLQLLANSGPSAIPRSFGQIVGQSALQAQQVAQQSQDNTLKRQLMRMELAQGAVGLGSTLQRQQALQQLFGGGQNGQSQGGMPTQAPQQLAPPPMLQAPGNGYDPTQPSTAAAAQPPPQPDPTASSTQSMNPQEIDAYSKYALMNPNANPLDVLQTRQKLQMEAAQRSVAPKLAVFDNVVKSDAPTRDVRANAQLMQTWTQIAPQFGIDPVKGFTDSAVRTVFGMAGNQIRAGAGMPSVAPPIALQQRGIQQIDPVTGKVEHEEELKQVIGKDGKPTWVPASQAVGMTPFNQFSATAAEMTGPVGQLDAALTAAGVNIPGGRSGQQRIASLTNLVAANPGLSADEIAQKVRTGQLDFNGAKRSTGQLSTLAASADVQSRKLEKDFAQLEPLVAKLPNAPAVINDLLVKMKNNLSFGGNKDTAELVTYLREAATEYAKLSSGSTGSAAPAEGNIKESMDIFRNAMTQGGYAGLKEAIMKSAQNKRDSVREGLQNASASGASVGASSMNAPAMTNSKGWALHTDKNGNRAYVSPDGKSYELAK